MNPNEARGQLVVDALAACPTLAHPSPSRDAVWFAVQQSISTRGLCLVNPLGSTTHIPVTSDHATDELLAAMEWLRSHEREVRSLPPRALFVRLRGLATRGADGSARAAQADALHGMTNVPPGDPVVFADIDPLEVA